MRDYLAHEVRNVAVLGHSGSGKTAVLEAMLYFTKASDRFGKTSEGSSLIDLTMQKKFVVDCLYIRPSFLLNGRIQKLILSIRRGIWILLVKLKVGLRQLTML